MYFDAYLKNRNTSISNPQPQAPIPHSMDPNNKFAPLRPPTSQHNLMIHKPPPFHEIRSDNKVNSSAHIYLSAAKATNLPPRVGSNLPQRPEITTSNLGCPTFSRHQLTDQQKYICHSPAKVTNRTSAGMVFEEIPQNRFDYRRSQSITDIKANDSYRESAINYYQATQRQTEYPSPIDNRNSTSPMQVKFNHSSALGDSKSRIVNREGLEGSILTNRQERTEVKDQYNYRKSYKDNYYDNLYPNKAQNGMNFQSNSTKYESYASKMHTEGNKYELQPRKYDHQTKKYQGYRQSEEGYRSNLYSIPTTAQSSLKRESSQDFLKKYSASNLPELDKTLDQQIETLRFANKKADQLVDRQMNKNTYLNHLFQQKGLKINTQEKPVDFKDIVKEKKEVSVKNLATQRQIQEKNKQIFEKNREIYEKNKEISEKSKVIIDKNKQIENLTTQLRELQERFDKISSVTESTHNQLLNALHNELKQKSARIVALENTIKDNQKVNESKQQQKLKCIDSLQKSVEEFSKRVIALEKQYTILKDQKNGLESIVKELTKSKQQNITKINHLLQQNSRLKEQSQSQKLVLINQYKKETSQLKSKLQQKQKMQSEKQLHDQRSKEDKLFLEAEIVSLTQRNNTLEQQLRASQKQQKLLSERYADIQERYSQIGSFLLMNESYTHQQLLNRLKQCIQSFAKSEGMQTKEIQRLQQYQIQRSQQQHLQRRHQQLSRELKKVGLRLAGASIQAQQGGRLLQYANNQIILMNLMNLNEKYKYLLTEQ